MANEIAKTASAELTRPDFIKSGSAGRDHITREDIKLPRLQIAQALTPEVAEGTIEGLTLGMLFNDLTKEMFGKTPIKFWIVRADPPHWIEFNPREQGGGIKDPNVKFGDPRTIPGPDGKTIATQYYDFVIIMEKPNGVMEPIALSLKGKAGTRAARTLNGLINFRKSDIFAGNYLVTPNVIKNALGVFGVYEFKNAGWASTQEELDSRKKLFEEYSEKQITIEREPGADDFPGDQAAM